MRTIEAEVLNTDVWGSEVIQPEILLKETQGNQKIDKRRIKGNRKRGRYLANSQLSEFNDLFPKNVDWLSRINVANILNLHPKTIDKYIISLTKINEEMPIRGFNREKGQVGLRRNHIRVLFEWHILVQKRGEKAAKEAINKRMLEVYPPRKN